VNADTRVGLYMVMEFLTGEDLQVRLERDKKLDVKIAVMIAHQVARGLAKAHQAGVVHRDLKPANIFLTQRDNGQLLVKLLDFGVSKLLTEGANESRITGSGTPIGTPLYMSPEQAEGKDDVDGRADLWSLGAVLYEALAGTPPFADRGSYHGTIVGILTSRPKLLADAAPWVPAELAKVVDALLVHDRDARIQNAQTITQRLLDAFPAVLPDGTGRHTAVIVSQAQAAVDTTGDTEVFRSSAATTTGGTTIRVSNTPPYPAGPASLEPRSTIPPSDDSARTLPDSKAPGHEDGAALKTGAATPVDLAKLEPEPTGIATNVKPTSSAQGVSLPVTPSAIDPLPMSEVPETTRDEDIALRADRRRRMAYLFWLVVLVGVAAAGYFMGQRRAVPPAGTPSTAVAPPPTSTVTVTATPSAVPAPSATATMSAAALPDAPQASAKPATTTTTRHAAPKASAPKTPYDEPPPPEAPVY